MNMIAANHDILHFNQSHSGPVQTGIKFERVHFAEMTIATTNVNRADVPVATTTRFVFVLRLKTDNSKLRIV